ncbi:MAG: hypothetical protein C4574_06520 [Candidatus Latescibacterota bacterium]|jgi:hypothetical protein|nr:MAG: hypothetical protein C4574_06520 [Candidatus Latescibacterota bacterium]
MPDVTTVAEIKERILRIESEATSAWRLLDSLDKDTVIFTSDRAMKCAPIIVCAPTIDNFGCCVRDRDIGPVRVEDLVRTMSALERWMGDIRRILENAPQDMGLPRA